MRVFVGNVSQFLATVLVAAFVAPSATAELLVYEPFSYTANTALGGQNGGTGFDTGSSWATQNNGTGSVSIKPDGVLSGVQIASGVINPYTNTYTSFPDSGNYVGPSDGLPNGGANAPDHMSFRRALSPAVTAKFLNGTKTYFSFTSARAMNSNARAPTLALGQGYLDVSGAGDRGDSIFGPTNAKATYGIGGNTSGAGGGSNAYPNAQINGVLATTYSVGGVQMTGMYLPQYWNATGSRTIGKAPGDSGTGPNISSVLGSGPLPGDHSFWMAGGGGTSGAGSLLYGYSSVNTPVSGYGDNQSKINIIVGEIHWAGGAGGTDLLSCYVFHDLDALSESAYDAGKSTFDTLAVSPADRSSYNLISVAGGRYFADEIRVATTFNEVVGLAPVPEPSTYALLGVAGIGSLIAARRRRR